VSYRAEYIWIDGTEPTALIRSKTRILADDETTFPIWGFDGSSTNQAPGDNSDCVLRPVYDCPDPIRGGKDRLVLCDEPLPAAASARRTSASVSDPIPTAPAFRKLRRERWSQKPLRELPSMVSMAEASAIGAGDDQWLKRNSFVLISTQTRSS